MNIKMIFAAVGLTVAAMSMSGAAEARDRWDDRRYDHDRRWEGDRRWNHDRRWANDRRWNHRRVSCWNEWHHHHRVRICR